MPAEAGIQDHLLKEIALRRPLRDRRLRGLSESLACA